MTTNPPRPLQPGDRAPSPAQDRSYGLVGQRLFGDVVGPSGQPVRPLSARRPPARGRKWPMMALAKNPSFSQGVSTHVQDYLPA